VQGQIKARCSHKVEGRLIVAGADDAAHSDVAAPEPFQTIQKCVYRSGLTGTVREACGGSYLIGYCQ
jgi:hypothetical protein